MEQNAQIAKMPTREGFGFEQPNLPGTSATPRGQAATQSPAASSSAPLPRGGSAKAKRRKTPEYTDSEDESDE